MSKTAHIYGTCGRNDTKCRIGRCADCNANELETRHEALRAKAQALVDAMPRCDGAAGVACNNPATHDGQGDCGEVMDYCDKHNPG